MITGIDRVSITADNSSLEYHSFLSNNHIVPLIYILSFIMIVSLPLISIKRAVSKRDKKVGDVICRQDTIAFDRESP